MAMLFSGLYLLHLAGLMYTTDFDYAAEDVRIKLPLFLFPIVFSTTEILSAKAFRNCLYLFLLVILSSTIVISVNYAIIGDQMDDIREASFLISHIRLALMICLSIAVAVYYAVKEGGFIRVALLSASFWFILFMAYFAYLTGIVVLVALLLFILFYSIGKRPFHSQVKKGMLLVLLSIFLGVIFFILNAVHDYQEVSANKEVSDLKKTVNNRPYSQWYTKGAYSMRENGYLVYQNICPEEVEAAWNKRSDLKVAYQDGNRQNLEDIILRYLASKGLPKDSASIASLSQSEIEAIEDGATNVNYVGKSFLYQRIYNMLWQYDVYLMGGNFNGHSLGTRLEFWKTGYHVFKNHVFIGTGTGDIEQAFQDQYELDKSKLSQEWRFRSHNQLISMAATFGLVGLIYFLLVIFLPIILKRNNFLYLCFALIFFISILTEDTLETQIGVTFYAFFNSLFYFQKRS
jgi:hypothetical protein